MHCEGWGEADGVLVQSSLKTLRRMALKVYKPLQARKNPESCREKGKATFLSPFYEPPKLEAYMAFS